jgi:hypothetical protein
MLLRRRVGAGRGALSMARWAAAIALRTSALLSSASVASLGRAAVAVGPNFARAQAPRSRTDAFFESSDAMSRSTTSLARREFRAIRQSARGTLKKSG